MSKIPSVNEVYFTEFKSIYVTFAKNTHYIFNMDKAIDSDCEVFKNSIIEWEGRLKAHLHAVLKKMPDFINTIEMLKKCEKLNLTSLDLEKVYISTIVNIITCN